MRSMRSMRTMRSMRSAQACRQVLSAGFTQRSLSVSHDLQAGAVERAAVKEMKVSVELLRRDRHIRSFEEIPLIGGTGLDDLPMEEFGNRHKHMERTFQELGPIYRERLGVQSSVNVMLPADVSEMFHSEGLHPERMTLQPWAKHREIRHHSKGVFLKNGEEWRADRLLLNREVMMTAAVRRFLPLLNEVAQDFSEMLLRRVETQGVDSISLDISQDLYRFALEASCHVLYGERIGLFSSSPSSESLEFIRAIERMLTTTPALVFLPLHQLLRAPQWTEHAKAWDHIFSHAETMIQKGFQRLSSPQDECPSDGGQYPGVLGRLLQKGQLSLDLIKANLTELMAGGVDTTAVPLQFALFELGRNPSVQEQVRRQVKDSWARAEGDPQGALQGAPLLKGTIREILRLYPVGITVQRYPIKDIVLQNYHVPAGTAVQACLYPMGRSPEVFPDPLRFDPGRWASSREEVSGERKGRTTDSGSGFKSLAFGFGSRQCVGKRIAENEMQLFLMHILLNFHVDVPSTEDLETTYTLILQPREPPTIIFSKL